MSGRDLNHHHFQEAVLNKAKTGKESNNLEINKKAEANQLIG